jgi:trans-aconitate methyltransferase
VGTLTDRWSNGTAYEGFVGRWSRVVAAEFLDWLDVPAGRRWVDVGCGTGVLTSAILDRSDPESIVGVDPSDGFLEHARASVSDPRASFRAGTAAETGLADAEVDVAVAGLVLNFVPDVLAALTEVRRVVRSGGIVGAYIWDYAEGMQFMRAFWDAAITLDAAAREHDEGTRFPIAGPNPLADAFTAARFESVAVRAIEIPTVFVDFDDLWQPFLGWTGTAPTYLASLDEGAREELREEYRSLVPVEPDGSIHLSARAWAVRGRR